jgi:hypothetical protein
MLWIYLTICVVEHMVYFYILQHLQNGILCVYLFLIYKQTANVKRNLIWIFLFFCNMAPYNPVTWCHIPKEQNPKLHCYKSLRTCKSHMLNVLQLWSSGMWHHVLRLWVPTFWRKLLPPSSEKVKEVSSSFLQNIGASLTN